MANIIVAGDATPADVLSGKKFCAGINYNAVGTMVAGSKTATGSGTTDGTFKLVVTGLTFLPRIIITTSGTSIDRVYIYTNGATVQNLNKGFRDGAVAGGGYTAVTSTGFTFTGETTSAHTWIAIE